MTRQEAKLLTKFAMEHWPIVQLKTLVFEEQDERFLLLKAQPCPFHAYVKGKSTCTVHAIRPFNCRSFACQRPHPEVEQFVEARPPFGSIFADVWCLNLRARLIQSAIVRKAMAHLLRKSQRWAVKHGWNAQEMP